VPGGDGDSDLTMGTELTDLLAPSRPVGGSLTSRIAGSAIQPNAEASGSSMSSSALAITPHTKRRVDSLDRIESSTSRSATSDLNKKMRPRPIQTSNLKNDSEISIAGYSPNASPNRDSSIVKPSYDVHKARIRRLSDDLSARLGTETARSKQTVITSKNISFFNERTKKYTEARGTTSGKGRSMSMTGSKALGATRYAEFLPKLPTTTGLAPEKLALALRNGLLNGGEFEKTIESLPNEKQKTALTQTVLLLHNEIINRSAGNLIGIIGAIDRQITHPEDKTLTERLTASSLFHAKGGQALSSFARKNKAEADIPAGQTDLLKNNAISLERAIQGLGGEAQLLSLSKQYADNLKQHWTFDVREPKPKPAPPRKITSSAERPQQNKKVNTSGKLRAFL
jgi:hypothetical protein